MRLFYCRLHIKTGEISHKYATPTETYLIFCAQPSEREKKIREVAHSWTAIIHCKLEISWAVRGNRTHAHKHIHSASVFCLAQQCDNVREREREYVRDYDFSDDNRWDISQRRKHNNNTLFVRQHSICFLRIFSSFPLSLRDSFCLSCAFNLATICSFFFPSFLLASYSLSSFQFRW